MRVNNIAIIITIIILVAVLVGVVVLVWWSGNPLVLPRAQEIPAKTKTVPYEVIKNHADEKGYEKYFRYGENWYANVNGEWKLAASKEEARQLSK